MRDDSMTFRAEDLVTDALIVLVGSRNFERGELKLEQAARPVHPTKRWVRFDVASRAARSYTCVAGDSDKRLTIWL